MVKSTPMARVEIYRLKKGGLQDIYAICTLVDEKAVCEGNKRFVNRLNTQGILDRSVRPAQKVFPSEGRRFLEVLKDHFNSGYLVASEVENTWVAEGS